MAVTRLKRKEAKNRSRAQVRTANLKRLNHKHNIPSPYKGESGIVLEDQENEAIVPEIQEAVAKVEEVKTEG
ncbi:MAG: hypothetical protein P8O20_00455 [Bacteroidia bacterium]|nr:hypothetical protein [Bacteroidia bacterium]